MFASLMPNRLYTTYEDLSAQGTGRGLSPALWKYVGGSQITPTGYDNGFLFADEFIRAANLSAAGTTGDWTFAEQNAGTAISLNTDPGGVLQLATATTADDGASIATGAGVAGFVAVDGDQDAWKTVIFEARIRKPVITAGSTFVGLTIPAVDTPVELLDNSHVWAAASAFIGFYTLHAAPTTLKFGYKAADQTAQAPLTYDTALAAADWLKVGFAFVPTAKASERLQVSVNNEIIGYVAQSAIYNNSGSGSAVATFPDGLMMGLNATVKTDSTTAAKLDLDWAAVWQEG
jgi:hypothetical protein